MSGLADVPEIDLSRLLRTDKIAYLRLAEERERRQAQRLFHAFYPEADTPWSGPSIMGGLIRQWRPWEKSTGPRTDAGKEAVFRNAFKGGTWRLLRELSRALREQGRRLVE